MCGVVGAIGAGDEFERQLHEATNALKHRGIRQHVVFNSAGGVGHVRLPIVGLGKENDQPRQAWEHWLIGFVGELLDFREDPNCKHECDTDLVVETWAQTGPHGFTHHDGFWGIVALDERHARLHIFTDYLGQKPMYYRADGICAAASEPDALLPFGPVTLDEVYLSACVKWGYCPDLTRTPYNEVKHVLPGEHVVLSNGRLLKRTIVDTLTPVTQSYPGNLKEQIGLAVKRRVLSSDVPVACLLSGGLDSSIVYKLAERHGDVIPYCAVGKNDDSDFWAALKIAHFTVGDYLGQVASASRLEPHKLLHKIEYDNVSRDEALGIMQEPIDLGSLRPQVALAKAIPQSVCLTGDGADECFGGYARSLRYDSQYSDVFMELPAWHLPRLDRAMMRNAVEVRSPFLARQVVELALGLPWEARKDKRLLRQLFADILPPSVTDATKKALRTPEIARDRETYSASLVNKFRRDHHERQQR